MTFDVNKTIKYWLESAAYDLETRKSLLEIKRFPYALFFGHLAIEKALKALVVKTTKEHAPYTHSLPLLAKKTGIEIPESIIDRLADIWNSILKRGTRTKKWIFTRNVRKNSHVRNSVN